MKLIKLLFLFLCVGLLLSKCQKEEIELGKEHPNTTEVSSLQNTVENRTYRNDVLRAIFKIENTTVETIQSRSNDEEILMANQVVYNMDREQPFMEDLVDRYGDPCWSCAYRNVDNDIFDVAVPFMKNGEVTSAIILLNNGLSGDVAVRFMSKALLEKISKYKRGMTIMYSEFIFDSFDATEDISEVDVFERSGCNCPKNSTVTPWANESGYNTTLGSLCICYNQSTGQFSPINISCCANGALDGGQVEGGAPELNINNYGDYETWLIWYTLYLQNLDNNFDLTNDPTQDDDITGGGSGIGIGNHEPNGDNIFWAVTVTEIAEALLELFECLDLADSAGLGEYMDQLEGYIENNTNLSIVIPPITNNGSLGGVEDLSKEAISRFGTGVYLASQNSSSPEIEELINLLEGLECGETPSNSPSEQEIEDEMCASAFDEFVEKYKLDLGKDWLLLSQQVQEQIEMDGSSCADLSGYEAAFAQILLDEAPCKEELITELSNAPYFGNYELSLEEQLALIGPSGTADCGNMVDFKNEVEDAIKADLINDCFDGLLVDAVIEMNLSFDKVNNLCSGIQETDPICTVCDESAEVVIFEAHDKALDLLDCAYNKIGNFDVEMPIEVKNCFTENFGGEIGIMGRRLLQVTFQLIKQGLQDEQSYDVLDNGELPCGNNNAYVLTTDFEETINICKPNWFNQSSEERAAIIIHEATHLYLGTADLGYLGTPEFSELGISESFMNADSFEELIQCLCD